jgi:BirA family biotin operon repressor/biotin-[acetyl-CoA-carboxylase] ligase
MLSKEHILGQLTTKWAARDLFYKDTTGSTNDDAKLLGQEDAPHGTLVVADRQTTGRGSRGRSWETPSGANIAMSLLIRPTAPPERISMLTLIMGLSVAEGVEEAVNITAKALEKDAEAHQKLPPTYIKWPNDVVLADKKICGILTELHMNPDNTINNVVIGVGINVNMTDFPETIKDVATSIFAETGLKVDRSLVVAKVMERFEENYEKYNRTFDLSLLKEQYEKRLISRGRDVRILDPKGEFEAISEGITDMGALIVTDRDGKRHEINAGEVTVRGLYTYA